MLRIHPAIIGVAFGLVLAIALGGILGPISCDVVNLASIASWGCSDDGSEQRWLYVAAGLVVPAVGVAAGAFWQAARRRAGIPLQAPDSPNRGIGAHAETATLPVPADQAFGKLREVVMRLGYRIHEEDLTQRALLGFSDSRFYVRLAARIDPISESQSTLTVEASPAWDPGFWGNSMFRKRARSVVKDLTAAVST